MKKWQLYTLALFTVGLSSILASKEAKAINLPTAQQGLENVLDEYKAQGWHTSSNSFFTYDGTQYSYNGAVGDKNNGIDPVLVAATLEGQQLPPLNDEYKVFDYDTAAFATQADLENQIRTDFGQHFLLVGMNEYDKLVNNMMDIFPNPSDGKFNIGFKNNKGITEMIIEAYDIQGKLVKQEKYLFDGDNPEPFMLEKDGFYFIRARNKNETYTKKAIVE